MKITKSAVEKIVITNAKMPNGLGTLDPIAVIVEGMAPAAGKITITCFGEAWSHYWSHMGEQHTLMSFFSKCDVPYLVGKLKSGIRRRIEDDDPDALTLLMKREVIKRRREGDINHEDARDLWNRIESWWGDSGEKPDLCYDVFGDDWWDCLPQKPNPDYEHLCQIVLTIQAAFKQLKESDQ